MDKWDPKWAKNRSLASRDNYWAGAKKACDDIGMSLPDYSKLYSLSEACRKDSSLGLPTTDDWFWSSEEYDGGRPGGLALYHGIGVSNGGAAGKNWSFIKVLCVGD